VLEAMAGQDDAARERDRFALELEAARGELTAMEAGVREQRDAMERLAGDVRSALERAEGAELERAGLAMRLGGLEDALVTECEVVREGLEGMEGVCVGLEQAMLAVEAECGQVSTLRRAGAFEGHRFLTQTWQVTRQLRDARVAQDEREREGGALAAALDGARREVASLGQALEERKAAAARLEEDARAAVERLEGAERESARLRERVCDVERGAGEWCISAGERLAGMEAWCGEMERAMGEAWGECEQVREAEVGFIRSDDAMSVMM